MNKSQFSEVDNWLAPCMFYLSVTYLVLLASVMVLWIDVPRVAERIPEEAVEAELDEFDFANYLSEEELEFERAAFAWGNACGIFILVIWPIFVGEQIYYLLRSRREGEFGRKHPFWWVFCLIPPLRMCAISREEGKRIWLPRLGWQDVDRNLQRRLERAFSFPMIWIALLILPVLGVQYFLHHQVVDMPLLRIALHFGTGLIWFAFTVEFIVMVSVAESRWKYCKKHWLDLVIILLPLVSFLRSLRLVRATRLVKVGKLQQLSRVVRVYRLRGVAMRAVRALMLLEVIHRLIRTKPEKRIEKLENLIAEKQREMDELQEEIERLKERFG